MDLSVDWKLPVGAYTFIVRNAPGHSPGSCIFYCQAAGILFAGDLVFRLSVGRTDLPGGDWETLLESIRSLVYTLPGETRILPGHGPETQVGEERCKNPYVKT